VIFAFSDVPLAVNLCINYIFLHLFFSNNEDTNYCLQMRFLGLKYANNAFESGTPGKLTALPHYPLAGKGGGAPGDGNHPEGGSPGRRGGGREGEGRGKGKIVATRCQILRLKCEDALYKYTYLLTSVIL